MGSAVLAGAMLARCRACPLLLTPHHTTHSHIPITEAALGTCITPPLVLLCCRQMGQPPLAKAAAENMTVLKVGAWVGVCTGGTGAGWYRGDVREPHSGGGAEQTFSIKMQSNLKR